MPILALNAAGAHGFWRLPDPLRRALAQRLPDGWELEVCEDAAGLGPLVRRSSAVAGWPFPAALARRAPDLRWVHFFSSGVPESWRGLHGIEVTSSAGVNADSVAEHGLFLALAAVRGVRTDSFRRWDPEGLAVARSPRSMTAVVLGHGAVGQRLARLLAPLFASVVSFTRTPRETGVLRFDRVASLLPGADLIVLALPLSDQSRALLAPESFFAVLKPDVILVNLARGELVDEPALLRFLEAHPESRYLADVAHPEPYAEGLPLWRSPQVLLTPHVAGRREDAWQRIGAHTLALIEERLR